MRDSYPIETRLCRPGLACLVISLWILLGSSKAEADEAVAYPPPEVRAWQTGLLRPDRIQHFSFACSSGLAAGIATNDPGAALGGAMLIGLAKELWDIRGTGFDWTDLGADAVGAVVAALVTQALTR
jgi:hypothetical protein